MNKEGWAPLLHTHWTSRVSSRSEAAREPQNRPQQVPPGLVLHRTHRSLGVSLPCGIKSHFRTSLRLLEESCLAFEMWGWCLSNMLDHSPPMSAAQPRPETYVCMALVMRSVSQPLLLPACILFISASPGLE